MGPHQWCCDVILRYQVSLSFSKYHGAGNDFIIIDDRSSFFPRHDHEFIAHLCHRRFGIGADGLLLIRPSTTADVKMEIYNSDGKPAKMCGNGLRCVAKFLSLSKISIETESGITQATLTPDGVSIELPLPKFLGSHTIDGILWHIIDAGVPHAVAFLDGPVDFLSIAKQIRHNTALHPEGVNVNIAHLKNNTLSSRTYERGVEDETLACGSGAISIAFTAAHIHNLPCPIDIIPASGDILRVDLRDETMLLAGPAILVYSGLFNV